MRCRTLFCAVLLAVAAVGVASPAERVAAATRPSPSCPGGTVLDGDVGDLYVTLHAMAAKNVQICAAVSPATAHQPPPPPPPTASGTCQGEPGAHRILDVQTAAGERAWIYTAPAPTGETDVCAGINGPLLAYGVWLRSDRPGDRTNARSA